MKIPFNNLHRQNKSLKKEILEIVENSIESSSFIGGESVKKFENEFKKFTDSCHCISVANGTDALYISLKYLNLSPDDEVIIPSDTWISTAEAVTQAGAKVIFADIDNFNTISVEDIMKKVSSKTKAIIPVHLYGQSADIIQIKNFCDNKGIYIIEDCAQAHMTYFNNIHVGNFGLCGTFSFYPSKNLGALGDAGCIITNNNEFAEFARKYANHGSLVKHQHDFSGINSRLDSIQASFLNLKLSYIRKWIKEKIKISDFYLSELKTLENVTLPIKRKNSEHSFHQFVINVEDSKKISSFLLDKGISTGVHYPLPLPLTRPYIDNQINYKKEFPISNSRIGKILSLPMYPEMNNKESQYITDSIKQFYK